MHFCHSILVSPMFSKLEAHTIMVMLQATYYNLVFKGHKAFTLKTINVSSIWPCRHQSFMTWKPRLPLGGGFSFILHHINKHDRMTHLVKVF